MQQSTTEPQTLTVQQVEALQTVSAPGYDMRFAVINNVCTKAGYEKVYQMRSDGMLWPEIVAAIRAAPQDYLTISI